MKSIYKLLRSWLKLIILSASLRTHKLSAWELKTKTQVLSLTNDYRGKRSDFENLPISQIMCIRCKNAKKGEMIELTSFKYERILILLSFLCISFVYIQFMINWKVSINAINKIYLYSQIFLTMVKTEILP